MASPQKASAKPLPKKRRSLNPVKRAKSSHSTRYLLTWKVRCARRLKNLISKKRLNCEIKLKSCNVSLINKESPRMRAQNKLRVWSFQKWALQIKIVQTAPDQPATASTRPAK